MLVFDLYGKIDRLHIQETIFRHFLPYNSRFLGLLVWPTIDTAEVNSQTQRCLRILIAVLSFSA